MVIETSRFGAIEVDEDRMITFRWGIPGFEELKRYVLLQHKDGPFQWLQAVDEPTVAFVVCPPELLGAEYHVPTAKSAPIELESEKDLQVLNLVSFAPGTKAIRFHMRSPLLFNTASRLAYQWSMDAEEVRKNIKVPEDLAWSEEPIEL